MKYMGSKRLIAKYIVPIIQSYINEIGYNYIEPFVGGANVIDKISAKVKYGSDINPYLIALLKQMQTDTSAFPQTFSEEFYKDVHNSYKNKDGKYPDWTIGLVGFNSYGARFFEGYPRGVRRDIVNEGIRNIIKQAPLLKNIKFACCSFEDIKRLNGFVIYCDPPYRDTKKYKVEQFPYETFYNWCRRMSKDNIVIVSEYNMPNDFECIFTQQVKCSLNNSYSEKQIDKVEKLFILK